MMRYTFVEHGLLCTLHTPAVALLVRVDAVSYKAAQGFDLLCGLFYALLVLQGGGCN
jgi:hypothetical protein